MKPFGRLFLEGQLKKQGVPRVEQFGTILRKWAEVPSLLWGEPVESGQAGHFVYGRYYMCIPGSSKRGDVRLRYRHVLITDKQGMPERLNGELLDREGRRFTLEGRWVHRVLRKVVFATEIEQATYGPIALNIMVTNRIQSNAVGIEHIAFLQQQVGEWYGRHFVKHAHPGELIAMYFSYCLPCLSRWR